MRRGSFDGRRPIAAKKDGTTTNLWWEAPKDALAKMVFATATYLADRQRRRIAANLHHLRVYSNRLAASLNGSAFTEGMNSGDRIRLNATKSAIDAAVAQIATNQPGVMHLTSGASYEQRKRAERLDKYVQGWFHHLQLNIAWLGVFLDSCIDGLGALKFVAKQNGKIGIERVRSDSIFVDDNEVQALVPGAPPRYMLEMRAVGRNVLTSNPMLKKFAKQIEQAEFLEQAHASYAAVDDPVTLIEAWKVPCAGSPGRHVIAVSNQVFLDEEWAFDKPPFAFFRWNDAPIGFYGIGAVEEVLPIQIELNVIAQKLQRLMHFATSILVKKQGSMQQSMTNEDWAVYEYIDTPPQAINMTAASGEFYNQIDRLYRTIYEILGVSQMSATGTKPPGLYSGDAIRLYHDVATRRYRHTEQRGAQFFIDCDEQVQDRAREIVKRGYGTARTLGMGDKGLEQLDWSDVAMEKDMFIVRPRPVSIIPSEPAGKVELIKTLAPLNEQMAPYIVSSISGIPDLEAMVQKANAPQAYAERLVSNIIEYGRFEPVEDVADLGKVQNEVSIAIQRREELGIPADRVSLLRRLAAQVDQKLKAQAMAQMMAAGMGQQMGGPPPMGGMPQIGSEQLAAGMQGPANLTPPGSQVPGL